MNADDTFSAAAYKNVELPLTCEHIHNFNSFTEMHSRSHYIHNIYIEFDGPSFDNPFELECYIFGDKKHKISVRLQFSFFLGAVLMYIWLWL